MKSRRIWWRIYAASAGTLILALVWITATVVKLERAEWKARADVRHQESMRLALWRLDSWLMPHLARESARPYFEYDPFYPKARAYTGPSQGSEPERTLTPSPLLSFSSEYVQLHFQMSPSGVLTSPQVPEGDMRRLAENIYRSTAQIEEGSSALSHLARVLRTEKVVNCVAESETQTTAAAVEVILAEHVPPLASPTATGAADAQSRLEWAKRKGTFLQNIEIVSAPQAQTGSDGLSSVPAVDVGPFAPLWITPIDDPKTDELLYIRRVRIVDAEYYQGFLCNWPLLRKSLLGEISDLFTDADLVPLKNNSGEDPTPGAMLATAPLLLKAGVPSMAALPSFGPIQVATGLTWLAVIAGLVAVGLNLRQSVRFGEKRSRFASSVTHELRTPLTTFRMYTEMLADDMVKDPQQRQVYLEALRDESGRLAALVENVLAYAQLEEGKRATHQSRVAVTEVIRRLQPQLERRADASGMILHVQNATPDGAEVLCDVEALGQILYNLVDNSCKYAHGASDQTILVSFASAGDRLHVEVADHGPGIPADQARLVFAPFERGRELNGNKPGLGLGLALSRRLARDLGGDLTVSRKSEAGACFRVDLPL